MNPILTVLVDAQVKSFQRRSRLGKVAQVKSFERQGQPGQKSPEEQSANRQSIHALKVKVTPDERARLITVARKAKLALMKKNGNDGIKLAREFYKMKDQLLSKYGLNQAQKKVAA